MIAISHKLAAQTTEPLQDGVKLQQLEQELGKVFAKLDCPGAYVGCFNHEGRELWFLEFSDSSRVQQSLRRFHKIRIASVSKLFIGRSVLLAADSGKVDLDDLINNWVPEVPGGHSITLRMLGRHESGLAEPIANPNLQNAVMLSPSKDWSIDELLKYSFDQGQVRNRRGAFSYSNANVLLLARVLEMVYKENYREIVKRQTLSPWGLMDTGYAPKELPEPTISSFRFGKPNRVIGFGSVFYDVSEYGSGWTSAAGDMFSTVDDLAIAIAKLASGDGLSDSCRKELYDWQPAGVDMQYGFLIENIKGWIGHTGNIPGYNVAAHYHLDRRLSVISATNLSNCPDQRLPAEELAKKAREWLDSIAQADTAGK